MEMDGKVSEMEAVQKKNKYEIDMCNGTIMDKLISFALPLMVSRDVYKRQVCGCPGKIQLSVSEI